MEFLDLENLCDLCFAGSFRHDFKSKIQNKKKHYDLDKLSKLKYFAL